MGDIHISMEMFTNERFKKLTSDAKLLFGLINSSEKMKDTMDEVYVIFPAEQAREMLNCCRTKVSKLFKELESCGLIRRRKRGRGMHDVIYLLQHHTENQEIQNQDVQKMDVLNSNNNELENVVNLYNSICKSYKRVELSEINRYMKDDILEIHKKYGLEKLKEMFEKVEESSFLKGSKGFTARFSWLIKSKNIEKILQGAYDDAPKQQTKVGAFFNYMKTEWDFNAIERKAREALYAGVEYGAGVIS